MITHISVITFWSSFFNITLDDIFAMVKDLFWSFFIQAVLSIDFQLSVSETAAVSSCVFNLFSFV